MRIEAVPERGLRVEGVSLMHLHLNRGNLRQKDWQDVADAVNALHGHTKKTHRTHVQCKNRIDTIKKKYKLEKSRVSSSPDASPSSWPFFDRLDLLIGPSLTAKKPPPPSPSPSPAAPSLPYFKTPSPAPPSMMIPKGSPVLRKRPASAASENGLSFVRNYSAMAAAAAAAEEDDREEEESEEEEEEEEEEREEGGLVSLAKAIERFGEVYERMEREKLRQMVDMEKQRMQFTKDLEAQRMNIFMDTQVKLGRIKRGKQSGNNGES